MENRKFSILAIGVTSFSLLAVAANAQALAPAPGPASAPDATAHPDMWPRTQSPAAITDAVTEARIGRIIAAMTLEQKVGQMIQADISSIKPEDLLRYPLGSILAGGNSGPYGNERADAATWAKLVGEFRAVSLKAGGKVPIIFGIDAVHGHANVPGATVFPHNIGLGAAHDPDLLRRIGAVTAAEVAASGIDWTFSPTLAVPEDMRWGRSYEGYAADPALVASYAKAMVEGLQGNLRPGAPLAADKVAATAKHYLADGGTVDGKDQGDAIIGERELIDRHAQGYPTAIENGALSVMASLSTWHGVRHHGNRSLLTDILKGRMGFKGLVVGDWNGHGKVAGCTVNDCPATFNAGLDMAMAPDSWKGMFNSTVRHVRAGDIPMARVDDAVRRILRVKSKLGLLSPSPIFRGAPANLGTRANLAVAREAVAKSLVLLKNEGVLPIKPRANVLVAGAGADNMALQAGGWTISWQGTDTSAADFPNGQTIGRAISNAVQSSGGKAEIVPDGRFTRRPDVAIVVYGEQPYAEFQGDLGHLAYRDNGEKELITKLKEQGVPVVSIFLSGRPLFVSEYINASDAFVAAWLPGTQGAGVADVLVAREDGRVVRDFTGRLPFAWPDDARSPVRKSLFPTGYGLDYRTMRHVAQVNEDPRIDLKATANEDRYMLRGKLLSPWRLGVDANISQRVVDLTAQEDGRAFMWTGTGALAIDGPPVNLKRQQDGGFALQLNWRVDAMPSTGPVTLAFAGTTLDVTDLLRALPSGGPATTMIPLRCFEGAGANFAQVGTPLRISAPRGLAVTIGGVSVVSHTAQTACPAKAD